MRRPPESTLFPYPTLFRSVRRAGAAVPAEVTRDHADQRPAVGRGEQRGLARPQILVRRLEPLVGLRQVHPELDRKSTRLNSSHANISYAVFCLKKKTHMYT